jgi:hypothetical protein
MFQNNATRALPRRPTKRELEESDKSRSKDLFKKKKKQRPGLGMSACCYVPPDPREEEKTISLLPPARGIYFFDISRFSMRPRGDTAQVKAHSSTIPGARPSPQAHKHV